MFIIVQDLSFNIINWASEWSRQSMQKFNCSYFFNRTLHFRILWRLRSEAQLIILKFKSWTMINIVILYFSLNFGVLKPISCFRIEIWSFAKKRLSAPPGLRPALGQPKAGLRPDGAKFGFWFWKPKMLSQGNQYRVEARITFQTTWSEQILHKPSLFFGKRRFLNFQNRTSQNANRP